MFNFFFRFLVLLYQRLVSPFFPSCCRFKVSCSNNMLNCLFSYGSVLGVFFGFKQFFLCHPWGRQRGREV